ncbi:beta-class carbonic anhydrase [Saccharomonospora iraqiensis]|uniref:beta-class carbonic anhydrase n=1 Tax=Saccharomonospora iraqiensis TaxID=52698 RepID=UPI000407CDEF|nr:carbonic anhydrase [Saccharomonospora iraqiensis]
MSSIDELLVRAAGRDRAATEDDTPAPPALAVAVVTCMDARIRVPELFGLAHGEAHVLRNAGGIVTDDVIRSLALSQRKLGTREVMVVGHTECGVSTVTEDGFRDELEADTGLRPSWAVEAFRDAEDGVRRSVTRVRRSPYLPHTDGVRGFVLDIRTRELREVA